MKYIDLSNYQYKEPYFYLGIEEYYLKSSRDEYFLLWSSMPAVIIGKHQALLNEVHLNYLKENKINLTRRFSGGGAVYADENNLMFTFILNKTSRVSIFQQCLSSICKVFKEKFNLDVTYSGRNDLLLNGYKISGSAFYYYGNRVIFHGTLLYDVDLNKMVNVLNPDHSKLDLKGIDSVRSRVMNLKDVTSSSLESIKSALVNEFTNEVIKDIPFDKIKPYIDHLSSEEYILGKYTKANINNKIHYKGGNIEAKMMVDRGIITSLAFEGDFFILQDLDILIKYLINIPYEKKTICGILEGIKVSDYILDMSNLEFINLLTKE